MNPLTTSLTEGLRGGGRSMNLVRTDTDWRSL